MSNIRDTEPSVQDEAARAGWLYYVGGMTQDQIASELGRGACACAP
jgi:DNA-binding transcriptional regulator LsrR (DeoR family)